MVDAVDQGTHCAPSEPAPQQTDEKEMCEGTLRIECCCDKRVPMSRTFVIRIPPQDESALTAFLSATATSWETSGYQITGHSMVDVGAGWLFLLTVSWYA